jgi:putative spermidine/putrescine transport system permease protein
MSFGATARHWLYLAAWLIVLFLLLPGLVSVPIALNDSRHIALPQGQVSLRHFETLFSDSSWLASMGQSAVIALTTTLLILAPLILPPVVSGLSLYRAWVKLGLYDTWLGVVIAHTILALPFVVIAVSTALSQLNPRLERASRSLGAGPLTTAIRIILPNIKAGLGTAALFAFIVSWDEIVVTLFVANRAVHTLPRRMWDGIRENVDPTVAAVATLLIGLTLLVVAAISVIQHRERARAASTHG